MRIHVECVSEVWKRTAGQVRWGVPMPRLRRDHRGLSRLRWLDGNQDGQEWPIPRLLELAGLQLHAKPSAVSTGAQHGLGQCRIQAAPTTLTLLAGHRQLCDTYGRGHRPKWCPRLPSTLRPAPFRALHPEGAPRGVVDDRAAGVSRPRGDKRGARSGFESWVAQLAELYCGTVGV